MGKGLHESRSAPDSEEEEEEECEPLLLVADEEGGAGGGGASYWVSLIREDYDGARARIQTIQSLLLQPMHCWQRVSEVQSFTTLRLLLDHDFDDGALMPGLY